MVNRRRHGQHVRDQRTPVTAGRARLPFQRPQGKDRDRPYQAGCHLARSVARLQPRSRGTLPGDRAGPRPLVQVHDPGKPRRRDLQRHRRARTRRHRRLRLQAGDGGQGRPVQEVRRHRRVRHRGGREGHRDVLQGGQGAGADVRRRQPRGREESRVLHHRAPAAQRDADPGVPRRSARDRHHYRSGPDQRPGSGEKADAGREGGIDGRGVGRAVRRL